MPSKLRLDRKNAVLYNKLGLAQMRDNDMRAARANFQKAPTVQHAEFGGRGKSVRRQAGFRQNVIGFGLISETSMQRQRPAFVFKKETGSLGDELLPD